MKYVSIFRFSIHLSHVFAYPQPMNEILVPLSIDHQFLQRRALSVDLLLKNGQRAQALNSRYSSLTLDSPCQTDDHACINGGFAQCLAGKYVNMGCAAPLKCFELREWIVWGVFFFSKKKISSSSSIFLIGDQACLS